MTRRRVELVGIELPSFGLPDVQPVVPADTYQARLEALEARYNKGLRLASMSR
jgi:hypothetical protein